MRENRELKFRAFRPAYETVGGIKIPASMWWFDVTWGNSGAGDGWIGMLPFGETDKRKREQRDPEDHIFMQYIGMKDKDGKEIYEGDIVETTWISDKPVVGVVYFFFGRFIGVRGYDPDCLPDESWSGNCWYFSMQDWIFSIPNSYYKVIGNIYENTELLERAK